MKTILRPSGEYCAPDCSRVELTSFVGGPAVTIGDDSRSCQMPELPPDCTYASRFPLAQACQMSRLSTVGRYTPQGETGNVGGTAGEHDLLPVWRPAQASHEAVEKRELVGFCSGDTHQEQVLGTWIAEPHECNRAPVRREFRCGVSH